MLLGFGLFEGIVDGHWKRWMRLYGETVHRLSHSFKEEGLGLLLAAMAVRA